MTRAETPLDGLRVVRIVELQRMPRINTIANSKLEIRNSKQFQMVKNQKVPNNPVSDSVIGIYILGFVSVRGASFELWIFGFD